MKAVFILSMPSAGSWNGKFSGADRCYARSRDIPKPTREKLIANSPYFYHWDDGWTARIDVKSCKDATYETKHSVGFMGYDWMINSLIKNGEINTPDE